MPALVLGTGAAWLVEVPLASIGGDYVAVWQIWAGTIMVAVALLALFAERWRRRPRITA